MEILDIYDKVGKLTGKTIERGSNNLQEGEYIKLVLIVIKSGDKFLIQKTSAAKGGEYAFTGGHVVSGNTSKMQAVIEIEEELGLKVKEDDLTNHFAFTNKFNHTKFDVYTIQEHNLENHQFNLQEEEVESVLFLSFEEVENLIKNGDLRKSSEICFKRLKLLRRLENIINMEKSIDKA